MNFIDRTKERWKRTKRLFDVHDTLRYDIRRAEMERSLYESTKCGISAEPVADREVVVSLTTYGRRLEQVYLSVESLLRQTLRPNRIVLWLDERTSDDPLPAALELQKKRGLEVRYTPDIRSYTKLIPALRAFPEALIITVDDDMLYDSCLVDRLVRGHIAFPGCVIANSASRLVSDTKFSTRVLDVPENTPGQEFLAYGCAGVLYPPASLDPCVFDETTFTRICPMADDIWFKVMELKAGTPVVRVKSAIPLGWPVATNPDVQDTALWIGNVVEGKNDEQYEAVMKHYGLTLGNK